MLEAWPHKPCGGDPRHRYSLANLRNLGRKVSISHDDASDRSLTNVHEAHASFSLLLLYMLHLVIIFWTIIFNLNAE
jgi:hypothetical protein